MGPGTIIVVEIKIMINIRANQRFFIILYDVTAVIIAWIFACIIRFNLEALPYRLDNISSRSAYTVCH